MKTNVSLRLLLLPLLALAGQPAAARAADTQTAPSARAEKQKAREKKSSDKKASNAKSADAKPAADAASRPPLKISVDQKPINRDAPDRISYAPIIKRTAGSVVYVYSSKTVRAPDFDLTPFLNDPRLRRFFDVLPPEDGATPNERGGGGGSGGSGRSTPRRNRNRMPDQVQQGLGSGVVITADGYILTNNHVVEGADEVKVSIGEALKRYDAKVVGRDAMTDIAVLKIEPTSPLTPAVFGDSEQLQVGDVVLAIGNPFGVGQSVSRGIVSALSRGVGIGILEDFIQTDAAINMGNSGGALIDTEGRVVGINTAILSRTGGFNGVGFAIPINLVRSVTEQIVNTGRVERALLGVTPQDLDEDLVSQFGTDKGALIAEVQPDSPADKAGLKPGDVITKVNKTEIRDRRHLLLTIGQLAPDTAASVEYVRNSKSATVSVTLGRRSDNTVASDQRATGKDVGVLNGVTVGDITDQMRDRLNIPDSVQGALITDVEPDSPSGQQGLREGDIILQLERRPVKNAEEAVRLSEEIQGPKVMVLIWRAGRGNQFLVIDESKK